MIRADDPAEFVAAWRRIAADPRRAGRGAARRGGGARDPRRGLRAGRRGRAGGAARRGRLRVLALFDKPDPLDGPFFEETIYVTPSRLPPRSRSACADRRRRGAPRSACATGRSTPSCACNDGGRLGHRDRRALDRRALLADAAVRHGHVARGADPAPRARPRRGRRRAGVAAAGVMMIPIPGAGVLEGVAGLDEARAVPGIEEVTISAHPGQTARAAARGLALSRVHLLARAGRRRAERAEAALREAHARWSSGSAAVQVGILRMRSG